MGGVGLGQIGASQTYYSRGPEGKALFDRTKLLKFGSHLKELNCTAPSANPYSQI